ncbi:hypothetical protein LXL04_034651 [Taraxacum kok-saghyz]
MLWVVTDLSSQHLLLATLLLAIRRFLPTKWNEDVITWQIPYFCSLDVEFTRSLVIAGNPGTFFCVWYVAQKHWLANNIFGLAFCIQGIEMLSLGSFKTGAILLLLFPTRDAVFQFSMLGLGDIVIPASIFVALALRFDVSRGQKSQYFKSAFLGYAVGVVLKIVVMNWFQAAQPALLYIVPSVIRFLGAHCIWNGEVKLLLEFDESKIVDGGDGEVDEKTSK